MSVEALEQAEVQDSQVEQPANEQEQQTPESEEQKENAGSEQEQEQKQPEESEKDQHKENRVQKRIDKLTREKYEYKGQLEALKQMLQNQNTPRQQAQQQNARPTRDQFENDEEYFDALTDYKLEQRLSGFEGKLTERQKQERAQTEYASRAAQAKTAYPDWDEVMEDAQGIPVESHVASAILESDFGPDVQYYLAKNPGEVDKLNGMSPASAARHIGRIEARIEGQKAKPKAPPQQSKAPDPIKPVRGGGEVQTDPDKMSTEQWMKWRQSQLNKKGR